ncbi:MAG: putative bifunctional diguanylate cyclase/phosphodiesterase, partial [Candidatus Methylomirabilis sp.]
TGLPNRPLFMNRLEQALARMHRRHKPLAVLFLDLDHLKVVNDSLGHRIGDQLLSSVGQRLQACLRPEDTIARFGGDEFVILLEEITDLIDAIRVAERIAEQLPAPLTFEGYEVRTTASIGIVLSSPQYHRPDDLLRAADLAMYQAKSKGRARYEVFDPKMNERALERLELGIDLRRAIEHGEFRVYYQPVIALERGRISEVEALVRWEHPRRGLLSPAEFIPLAEETGLIVTIGQWVMEEACRQARVWQVRYPSDPPLVMSVNLSARQFQQPGLVEDVARALSEAGLHPASLKLEITESAVMEDEHSTIATMQKLKALGVKLAIDDFGVGYSSLSYLRQFPVDALKVDRVFIGRLGQDPVDMAIVHAVIAVAKSLNLSVTAEGVETDRQLAHLRDLGCKGGQGYYFAKPLPSDAFSALMAVDPRW